MTVDVTGKSVGHDRIKLDRKCALTFTLGQTEVYIRANLPTYVFAFTCALSQKCDSHAQNLHTYVSLRTCKFAYVRMLKNATSIVTLCSHEFYRQMYFSINTSHFLILIKVSFHSQITFI